MRRFGVALLAALVALAASARAGDWPAPGMADARPLPVVSDAWIALRTLMPGDVVQSDSIDRRRLPHVVMDLLPRDRDPIGLEVKRHVSMNRPLTVHDVGPISLVHANAEVRVFYRAGALSMQMQGRALEAGGQGEQIRVLNTASSRTIRATVVAQDTVEVKGGEVMGGDDDE